MKLNHSRPCALQIFLIAFTLLVTHFSYADDIKIDVTGGTTSNINVNTAADDLILGENEIKNVLNILDGAEVSVDNAFIATKLNKGYNTLTVTGDGSLLFVTNNLTVGNNYNELHTKDKGWIYVGNINTTDSPANGGISVGNATGDASITIGSNSTATAANLLIGTQTDEPGEVTLSGAIVTLSENLRIGTASSTNEMLINDGASLTVNTNFILGSVSHTNNTLTIDNGEVHILGKTTVNNPSQNTINVKANGFLGISDSFNLDNNANGYNLEKGATLQLNKILLAEKLDSERNIILTGEYARWSQAATNVIYVGHSNANNSLTIKNGALLTNALNKMIYIGDGTNSFNNTLTITGSNSTFIANGETFIGNSGSNNKLSIEKGGTAVMNADVKVGYASGANDNEINISGSNTVLTLNKKLYVGVDGSRDNAVNVSDHGTLSVDQGIVTDKITIADNNRVNINYLGHLSVSNWDFSTVSTSSLKNLSFDAGSFLEVGGELKGTNEVNFGLSYVIKGAGANWTTTNDLTVTQTSSSDGLNGEYNSNNKMLIHQHGLQVLSGGYVEAKKNMEINHLSTLKIDAESSVYVKGDYSQVSNATLAFGIGANTTHTNLMIDGTASFENEAKLVFYDDGVGSATNIDQVVLSAEAITVGLDTPDYRLTGLNITTNGLIGFEYFYKDAQIHVRNFTQRDFKDLDGLYPQLSSIATALDTMRAATNSTAQALYNALYNYSDSEIVQTLNAHYGEKASTTPMNNVVNQALGSFVDQINMRGDSTRSRLKSRADATGAAGPHAAEQPLQAWIQGYDTSGTKKKADGYDGYDSGVQGFILGVDLSVAPNVLVGVAGGTAGSDAEKDSGANSDASSRMLSLYSSIGTQDWFLDGSFTLGMSSIDHNLGTMFDTTSSYDANNMALYLGGGKEMIGDYMILTPRASILMNMFKQDAYEEKTSTNAFARAVDGFDAMYLQSSVGIDAAFYMQLGEATFRPELRLHWLHEFNTDEESVNYQLINGTGSDAIQMQSPDADIIKLGLGMSARLSENSELRFDIDLRRGKDYADRTYAASLRYQF